MHRITHPFKASPSLKSTVVAAAVGAALFINAGPPAQASLVGQWLTGPTNLNETSGFQAAGTHDGVAVGSNAGALAFSSDVPPGYTGQSLDLRAGNVGVAVLNSSTADGSYRDTFDNAIRSQCSISFWAKGFPGEWSPWVSKRGEGGIGWQIRRMGSSQVAGFTLRGVDNEDGWGSSVNVDEFPAQWHHYAGVWNQATGTRTFYVDGVYSHVVNNNVSQLMAMAANQRLCIGCRANGGTGYESFFMGLLYNVRIYNHLLTASEVLANVIPEVPTGLTATVGNSKVALTWNAARWATSYTVWTQNTLTLAEQTDVVTTNSFSKTGLTNGTPYKFKVLASNAANNSAYSADVSATPVLGSAKDILTFSFGPGADVTINGTNLIKYLPAGTNVTQLAPTFTTSPFSSGSPASGTVRDFTYPQTYTVTAEDGSTKNYTVTVFLATPLTYDFTGDLQGWTQLWPTPPSVLLQNNALGSGYDNDDPYTRFARSPGFYLLDSGPLTFYLDGGQSPLPTPAVGPAAIPENAINGGGFAGVALRDVDADTYVLSKRRSSNGGGWIQHQFTPAELAPFVNNGKQYTLDYIDYNSGGWGWTYLDNVSIPGVIEKPGTAAQITAISIGSLSHTETFGQDIIVTLPNGSSVTSLTPGIVVSPEATLSPPHGTTRDFTNPQLYTVTSGDGQVTNEYTVTVRVGGSLSVKTYDNTFGVGFLEPISNLMGVTPSASATKLNNISYGNFLTGLPGLTNTDTFAVLWEGWFNVTMEGLGDYTFGTQSDDGSMIYLDLNDDGDFTDPGELVVNNNGLHGNDIRTGSVNLPMDSVRMAIGYFEDGGGEAMEARFGFGKGLNYGGMPLIGGLTGHFTSTRPAINPSSAALWQLSYGGQVAKPNGTNLLLVAPYGSNVTALNPTFAVSPGATCVPPSGTVRDFSTPQTYTVTSQDSTTVVVYTVTARVAGSLNVRTYDDAYGVNYLAPLSTLQGTTPSAVDTLFTDISFTAYSAGLPGLTNGDFFSVLWDGWFDVSEEGPGFYTFGTRSDDGSALYLDLNNDGDFDDPGEMIVNNNRVQGATSVTTTVYLPMDTVKIAVGYFEVDGNESMEARCKKGSGLAYDSLDLIGGSSGLFFTSPTPSSQASAGLWYLTYGNDVAKATTPTELVLFVPTGTDLTTLAPTFMQSQGSTCVPPSGTARNFTTPQTYEVTSQDHSTTITYTVRVYQSLRYDFNNATLQGWHNRVWDLSANGGSGGWIDLAPNSSTFPTTVNGGISQPPSVDNGLFSAANGAAWPNGEIDNHLNTLWLQSPAFYLDSVADLTVDLSRGANNNAVDPVTEMDIPFAAVTNTSSGAPGGWKGVALRRVSDGTFLIAKPRTGANGDEVRTVTFTAAELEPFDGVACTLDLINTDRGGWGWIVMDNVIIPATALLPVSSYDSWRAAYPDLVGTMGQSGADPDADGFNNFEEFAFGTNPSVAEFGVITYAEGSVTAHGQPVLGIASGYSAIFGRRVDWVAAGLTYTVEFSANLSDWVANTVEPTVLATDATIQAVEVAFPATIDTPAGQKVPKFFRVKVTQN